MDLLKDAAAPTVKLNAKIRNGHFTSTALIFTAKKPMRGTRLVDATYTVALSKDPLLENYIVGTVNGGGSELFCCVGVFPRCRCPLKLWHSRSSWICPTSCDEE